MPMSIKVLTRNNSVILIWLLQISANKPFNAFIREGIDDSIGY